MNTLKSPSSVLWNLILVLAVAVASAAYTWKLPVEQVLSASVAAAAIPLAFLSQRAILREDQKQKMRYEAYRALLNKIQNLESALTSVSVDLLRPYDFKALPHDTVELQRALAEFTNCYHAHEMVFAGRELWFKYIHFSLICYCDTLGSLKDPNRFEIDEEGGLRRAAIDKASENEASDKQDLAGTHASYLFDLKKELIKTLGFAKLTGENIEKRKPKNKKYKLLSELATRQNVDNLEKLAGFKNE